MGATFRNTGSTAYERHDQAILPRPLENQGREGCCVETYARRGKSVQRTDSPAHSNTVRQHHIELLKQATISWMTLRGGDRGGVDECEKNGTRRAVNHVKQKRSVRNRN